MLALAESLKEFGLKAVEAINYIEEFQRHVAIPCSKARQPDCPNHEAPSASDSTQAQVDRDRAVEEAAWTSFRSHINTSAPALSSDASSNVLDEVFQILAQEDSPSTLLSKLVLAVAPHFADNNDSLFEDPYIYKTQKCKVAYANQKPFNNLIIVAQGRKVQEPITNSVWRLVILDKYVNFEKLYVMLDPGYNPDDEAKELTDKFLVLEKHTISSRRPVSTEAEWIRLFDIWVSAVLHFYPHCRSELASYRDLILNMFRATHSPLPAIQYDRDSRERYSRQPYRLDSSKNVLPFPLLSQLLSSPLSPPSSTGSNRRSPSPQTTSFQE